MLNFLVSFISCLICVVLGITIINLFVGPPIWWRTSDGPTIVIVVTIMWTLIDVSRIKRT